MSSDYLRRDGIKMFQIINFMTYARLLGIKLMFSFKNIDVAMSLGLRDDRLGAMTSCIPLSSHSHST